MQVDVLAFGPHPDDVELLVGGTLLRLASLGYRTAIVDLTAGEMGTRGTREKRAAEAEEAAKRLGARARPLRSAGRGSGLLGGPRPARGGGRAPSAASGHLLLRPPPRRAFLHRRRERLLPEEVECEPGPPVAA